MIENIQAPQLAHAAQNTRELGYEPRAAASPGSVARFEQLLYAPAHAPQPSVAAASPGGLRTYLENLSQRWDVGQGALQNLADAKEVTSKDLVLTQIQMVNCALDVEVSARCAGSFENGVQTLTQRS